MDRCRPRWSPDRPGAVWGRVGTVLVAETGRVTPAPDGSHHVEQVGWGVARQVARVLEARVLGAGSDGCVPGLLADVVRLAEVPGFLAYAVFEGRSAVAIALVSLPGGDGVASYVGDVVVAGARDDVRQALLVRALHDVGNAGVHWLEADLPVEVAGPLGFERRDGASGTPAAPD
jgi:hypothetical protein